LQDNELGFLHDSEKLKLLVDNDIIDIPHINQLIEMNDRKEKLHNHPYSIWQGKNGYWYTYITGDNGKRVQKKRSTRKGIEDAIVKFHAENDNNPTFLEEFNAWNDRRFKIQRISGATYLRNISFAKHLGKLANRKIKNIAPKDIVSFLEEQISKQHLTSKAFSGFKGIIRGTLKHAKREGLFLFNVDEVLGDLDVSEREFKKNVQEDYEEVYDETETKTMVSYLNSHLDDMNEAILLTFMTGLRVGELTSLKHEDLDPDGIQIKVRRTESRTKDANGQVVFFVKDYPKTKAGLRAVVVPEQYQWLVKKLYKESENKEYVFMRPDNTRMNTASIRRRLRNICDKLNIYQKSPHKIRKTYGTILMDSGVDLKFITDQMGHEDIGISEKYYHRNRKTVDRKSKILSGIKDFDLK
jgi:integrase